MNNFKIISMFMLMVFTTALIAQNPALKVGLNPTTINSSAVLDAESTTKGFLPPRMTTAQRNAIANPAKGLVIYDTTLDCLSINKGTPAAPVWECIGASAAPTATVDCNATAFAGTYVSGTAMSGTNNYVVTVVNNSLSPVSVTMQSSDLVLSGVAGLAVGTPTPSTLSLAGGGSGTVSYPITGNPTACGTLTGVWTKISLTCTKTVTVSPTNFILPSTGITYNSLGEVSGFTANWTAQVGATGYTVEQSTSESGPWTAFASNPYTGTSAAVIALAGNYAYWVRITLVGGSCAGATSISNGPAAGCAAKINATTWKTFMCHNLGANPTLDPHDMGQTNAWGLNGAYIQWGQRGPNTTGNSVVDWVTAVNTGVFGAAPTGSTAGTANSGAIAGWNISAAPDNSWRTAGGAKTANDPCPTGYEVPTNAVWTAVLSNNTVSRSGTWSNSVTNYGSALHFGPNASVKSLTLPANGHRDRADGRLLLHGFAGEYWSSDSNPGLNAFSMYFETNFSVAGSFDRLTGASIRCVKQ